MSHAKQMRRVWGVLFGAGGIFWITMTVIKSASYDDFCNRIGHDIVYLLLATLTIAAVTFIGQLVDKYIFRQRD